MSRYSDPKKTIIDFVRKAAGDDAIHFSAKIAESEKKTGFTNNALINLMKSFGNIHNDIDTVLDVYFYLCSIEMTCKELAKSFLFLASDGNNPFGEGSIIDSEKAKRINSVMQLCGFYDEAGEFAFRVGLPGKSGVGGGIIAIHPERYSVAVWSPLLNEKGNSFKGMNILECLTTETKSSIF